MSTVVSSNFIRIAVLSIHQVIKLAKWDEVQVLWKTTKDHIKSGYNYKSASKIFVQFMKFIIGLTLLALSQARYIEPECDLVSIHNIYYEKEVLKDKLSSPYQLALDYDTNTLFFSVTVDPEEKISEMFQLAYLNLKTNEYKRITDIPGGFAATVDKNNHKVFLGGNEGIYEFDFATQKSNRIDNDEHSIWQMFFKDKLYYTTYPNETAYTFEGGVSTLIPELKDTKALVIAVDSKHNLYFKNSTGLFNLNKDGEIVFLGDYNVNGVTTDNNDNLYFSTPEGLYNIDASKNVNKLASLEDVYGLAIEGDGSFIYTTEVSIIRLKPTKKTCTINEKD